MVRRRVRAQVAPRRQPQGRAVSPSRQMAQDKDKEDRLQGGPVREAQQEEALLCAVFGLKEETSQNVWKDDI